MNFQAWYDSIVGHKFDGDNDGSFDCVDVAESWVMHLWPSVPEASILGYGNAKDLFNASSPDYFRKINYSAGLVPLQGDIIVYGATPSNPYGHIAVVISATASSVSVVQENSYTQQAAYVGTLGYSYCLGFLRIKGATMSKEEVTVLYMLAVPGQGVNQDFVAAYTNKPLDDVLHALQNDPSIQKYISGLLHPSGVNKQAVLDYINKNLN